MKELFCLDNHFHGCHSAFIKNERMTKIMKNINMSNVVLFIFVLVVTCFNIGNESILNTILLGLTWSLCGPVFIVLSKYYRRKTYSFLEGLTIVEVIDIISVLIIYISSFYRKGEVSLPDSETNIYFVLFSLYAVITGLIGYILGYLIFKRKDKQS